MFLFFYIFATLTVICSFMVVFSKNSVHSVFWLIGSFINASSLIVLIGAEFIAMVIVIIYVGAVAVLFLFVIMMINIKNSYLKIKNLGLSIFAIFISCFLLFVFLMVMIISNLQNAKQIIKNANSYFSIMAGKNNLYYISKFLYSDYILVFQVVGLALFVAIVASIAITHVVEKYKKQNLFQQLFRTKRESVKLVDVVNESGIEDIKYDE